MAFTMQKNALLLILGYVATAAAAGGSVYVSWGAYRDARDEEARLRAEVETAEIKISRIPGLETDVICLRENVSELVKILPDSKEVNEFVNKLNDFAAEAGVGLRSLKDEKDRSKTKDAFDKVIYKVQASANLAQFLDFLSSCEGWERFVKVTSLDIKSGKWDEDVAREDVRHDISVDLETYSYRGNEDPSKVTPINNYEKRREALADEIVSRRADIRVERYNLVPNPLRRDPFVDPRRRLADEKDGGLPWPEQKALVEELTALAGELKGLAESVGASATNFIRRLELESEIDRKVLVLQDRLDVATHGQAITDASLKRRIERDVLPILQQLLQRDASAAAAATLDDLRRFADDMQKALEAREYRTVLTKNEIIANRIDKRTLTAEGAAVLGRIEQIALHAEVAQEFEGKEIDIRGAVIQDRGSVVVVNGHVLREGEAVEDGLVVHRIRHDWIEFRYRGVVLARPR